MKTLGIVGGFGPDTTAKFQLRIVELFNELSPAVRPSILMCSPSIPTFLEHNLIINGQGLGNILPHLRKSAQILEKAGADFIVLPCNTLHVLFDQIQVKINIPLLNIINESIKVTKNQKLNKIAILGTSLTIKSNMHRKLLFMHNIEAIIPSINQQNQLDNIIHQLVIGGNDQDVVTQFSQVITQLKPLCSGNFLLACTDLQLIKLSNLQVNLLDSMEILAQASVKKLLI